MQEIWIKRSDVLFFQNTCLFIYLEIQRREMSRL